ncbi:MAG: hypothetical protein LBR23_04440 [Spirochaetaceae bacterium]|jgi:hypothetical protein|nr:hypothetical protein [Spirochaetaceae bacterium]
MRALVVAEKAALVSCLQGALKSRGEVIVYGNPLKAMDNIDEINPSLAVVSAAEFPCHWKVLAQFLRALGGCEVILLTDSKFDNDERAKAGVLGIKKMIPEEAVLSRKISVLEKTGIDGILSLEEAPAGKGEAEAEFLFRHPQGGFLVTGAVESLGENSLVFRPDLRGGAFKMGDVIRAGALKRGDSLSLVDGEVLSWGETLEVGIQKHPKAGAP